MHTWLCELRMEDYWELFNAAGYDMPTISRMTPEVRFCSSFDQGKCGHAPRVALFFSVMKCQQITIKHTLNCVVHLADTELK